MIQTPSLRCLIVGSVLLFQVPLGLATEKPNVLAIVGDDIGYSNLSCNNDGMRSLIAGTKGK